jgi:fructoselysine-6-P-deglycase FrlB-like protein
LEGDKKTARYNLALAEEVLEYGSNVFWIGNHPGPSFKSLQIPDTAEIALPLAELLPMQLIAYVLSTRKKIEAGKFRRIGKIVLKE